MNSDNDDDDDDDNNNNNNNNSNNINNNNMGEKDWLKNLIVKEREVKSGLVLERESAGIQLQGKFFVLDSVERWAAVACHQNITPFPFPVDQENTGRVTACCLGTADWVA